MVWGAFTGFDKCPLVTMPLDKRTTSDLVTIFFKGALSRFYFLYDHLQELKLMEDGALVHYSSLPFLWKQVHSMTKLI